MEPRKINGTINSVDPLSRMPVQDILPKVYSLEELEDLLKINKKAITIVLFHIGDHLAHRRSDLSAIDHIIQKYPCFNIFIVTWGDSDKNIWLKFNVGSYPLCIFFKNCKELNRATVGDGKDILEICERLNMPLVEEFAGLEPTSVSGYLLSSDIVMITDGAPEEQRNKEMEKLVKSYTNNYKFHYVGHQKALVKSFASLSMWPVFPQLYKGQEFVGTLDSLKRMDKEILSSLLSESYFDDVLGLINSNAIMIFMKGTPENPVCKFSRMLMSIIGGMNISFGYFDILGDEKIREKLKKFSDWPTYPQVYYKGKLIGGVDIIMSMHEDGSLLSELTS